MTYLSNFARPEGDPRVLQSGPSSLSPTDRLARQLGWFSIGLGLTQLFAARRITRALGMEGKESLMRACGTREIASGVLCLSLDKQVGLWSRVAGDAVDIATLAREQRQDNPKRDNVNLALAMVIGITALDVICAQRTSRLHCRSPRQWRDYSGRSGFPQGISAAQGQARDQLGTTKSQSPVTSLSSPAGEQGSGLNEAASPETGNIRDSGMRAGAQ
ncbi:hypothetical protein [Rhodoligotrophos ferricapiens]|uniref:hypothetical protein n=1 Tax=Rhodoligotrophos ferricapiens TaxID=3069264 RepID=UPI00315CC45D